MSANVDPSASLKRAALDVEGPPRQPTAARIAEPAGGAGYRPEIDGLRALAVLAVVLFHVGFSALGGGFVGVDVFFVISGYLITSILKRGLDQNAFSLVGFYERRARRILPALIVMTVVVGWVSYRMLAPNELLGVADALVCVALFASNIYFYAHSGYWDAAARDHPLLHTWSLGVEEQFYIVFPLLLAALHRWARPNARPWILAAIGAVSLAMSGWAAGQAPEAGFYLSPFRAFELIVGAMLAYGPATPAGPRWWRELLAGGGLALIGYAVLAYSEATPFPGLAALIPCLGAAAILYAGSGGTSVVRTVLSAPPVVFVGKISYSLYLWHWPLIVFTRLALGRPFSISEKLLLLAASIAAATFSWAFVERPFRRRTGKFIPRTTVFAIGAAWVVAAGVFDQQARSEKGWPNRLPPAFNQIDVTSGQSYRNGVCNLQRDSRLSDWKNEACVIHGAGAERILWWGDSFAAQYAPALSKSAADLPFSVVQYNYAGCAPVFGFQPTIAPNCNAFNDNVFAVASANHVRTIVLVARWEAAIKRGLDLRDLQRTVQVLRARGYRVVVVGQSPVFVANAARIFAWRRLRETTGPLTEVVVFPAMLNGAIRSEAAGATFIDPMPAFCRGMVCVLGEDNRAYFVDDGHMTLAGSLRALAVLRGPIATAAR